MSTASPVVRFAAAETRRWLTPWRLLAVVLGPAMVAGGLAALSVATAAGRLNSSGNISLEVTGSLTRSSPADALTDYAGTAVNLVLPLSAIVIGTLMGAADHRLRTQMTLRSLLGPHPGALFAIRLGCCALLVAASAILASVLSRLGALLGVSGKPALDHLDPWQGSVGHTLTAVVAGCLWALLSFGLAALAKTTWPVLVALLVFVLLVDGVVGSLWHGWDAWSPRRLLNAVAAGRTDHLGSEVVLGVLIVLIAAAGVVLEARREPR